MKYFAKYLPIEGEIKEGDKVVYKTFPEVYTVAAIQEVMNSTLTSFKEKEGYQDITNLKKVKLFLCSRDIQVGDELTFFWGDGRKEDGKLKSIVKEIENVGDVHQLGRPRGVITKNHQEFEMQNGFYWNKDFSFKVIGEISPEATWVKEGDEFEEEIQHFFFCLLK